MSATVFSKICETVWMAWAFFVVGINYSILGPTLLDLQLILKQDLETLSTIPLSSGVGETLGMFLALALSKYGHKRLQLGIALLLASVVFTLIPVVPSFIYVDIMFALVGFISAIPSCFLIDVCSELWEDKGTAFQFILVGSSLGAIVTPLIVEPFLCHGDSSDVANLTDNRFSSALYHSMLTEIASVQGSCSMEDLALVKKVCVNVTRHFDVKDPQETQGHYIVDHVSTEHTCPCKALMLATYNSTANCPSNRTHEADDTDYYNWQTACDILEHQVYNTTGEDVQYMASVCCPLISALDECRSNYGVVDNGTEVCTESDTHVRSAYVVMGLVLLPTSLAFFYFWWNRDSRWAFAALTESQRQGYQEMEAPNRGRFQVVIFYTVLFLSYLPLTALTIVFATYLTAFGVESNLHLPKSTMVYMTSVFWISTLLGRIISTILTPQLGHAKIIIGNFAGLVVSSVLLASLAPYYESMLWMSTVLLGVFSCPYEGAGLAWAADYVGMSPRLVALSWISVSLGNLAFPFLGGLMFTHIGPTAFMYLLCSLIIFMVLMFILLNVQVRCKSFKT
ncbi:major facilitator superfamily domain-containing protein 4B-like [Haliotis asinina]|uniref:major facilitator superfamily domain-containing protein 4B-like n=1 Tax=Haliotis asinina TaxID=109174 RepID=UPI00353203AB